VKLKADITKAKIILPKKKSKERKRRLMKTDLWSNDLPSRHMCVVE
jgi:hypothetical protein